MSYTAISMSTRADSQLQAGRTTENGRRYVQNGWPSPLTSERRPIKWTLNLKHIRMRMRMWLTVAAGLTISARLTISAGLTVSAGLTISGWLTITAGADHRCGADHLCADRPTPSSTSIMLVHWKNSCRYTSIFCNCSFITSGVLEHKWRASLKPHYC